jgi:hypothetical protein
VALVPYCAGLWPITVIKAARLVLKVYIGWPSETEVAAYFGNYLCGPSIASVLLELY